MAHDPLVPKDDVQAAIEARRELGPDHEHELVESFVARIEERLAKRPAATPARGGGRREGSFVLTVVSLGVGIPLTAIALESGLAALLIVWVGIVLVNVAYQRG